MIAVAPQPRICPPAVDRRDARQHAHVDLPRLRAALPSARVDPSGPHLLVGVDGGREPEPEHDVVPRGPRRRRSWR